MRVMVTVAALFVIGAPSLADPADAPLFPPACAATGGGGPKVQTPVMVEGFGWGGFPVRASPAGQSWFDYGMKLTHAFNHKAAITAMKAAREADPACAMCVWGEAFVSGPTINFGVDRAKRSDLAAMADLAATLSRSESERNRGLIAALQVRYHRGDLDFARAMDALADRFGEDDTIQIIAADANLIASSEKRMDLVRKAEGRLKTVLDRHPDNSAAIHFYIHATEFAGEAGLAESFADRLARLAPAASHLIHMPSHTYFRVGRYEDGAAANLQAVEADKAYMRAVADNGPIGQVDYHSHDVNFGLGAALMAGDGDAATRLARHALEAWPKPDQTGPWTQIAIGKAYVALARTGHPDAVQDGAPAAPLLAVFWRYAKGESAALRGDAIATLAQAKALEGARLDFAKSGPAADLGRTVRDLAVLTLKGRAAMIAGDARAAIAHYRRAAALQDRKFGAGGDPPDWWFPLRRSLAAALLESGDAQAAVVEASRSLKDWPRDPVALHILARAESRLDRAVEAEAYERSARALWRGETALLESPALS